MLQHPHGLLMRIHHLCSISIPCCLHWRLYISGHKHEFQGMKETHATSVNSTEQQKQWSQEQHIYFVLLRFSCKVLSHDAPIQTSD